MITWPSPTMQPAPAGTAPAYARAAHPEHAAAHMTRRMCRSPAPSLRHPRRLDHASQVDRSVLERRDYRVSVSRLDRDPPADRHAARYRAPATIDPEVIPAVEKAQNDVLAGQNGEADRRRTRVLIELSEDPGRSPTHNRNQISDFVADSERAPASTRSALRPISPESIICGHASGVPSRVTTRRRRVRRQIGDIFRLRGVP